MPFSNNVREDALVSSGRHCCLCHKFCGIKLEVHHIRLESEGGKNTLENAIPLCFDCHADMTSYDKKHPKGTKYSENELKRHRDNWYKKVHDGIGLARQSEIAEIDKQIYSLLLKILPWYGSIDFIRHYDFRGSSFERSRLDGLSDFLQECKNPAFEFVDPDLEGLKSAMCQSIKKFMGIIGVETFPTHFSGCNSVPIEWIETQPERFEKVVELLHTSADEVCDTYDALVKLATRKLGILPGILQQSNPQKET